MLQFMKPTTLTRASVLLPVLSRGIVLPTRSITTVSSKSGFFSHAFRFTVSSSSTKNINKSFGNPRNYSVLSHNLAREIKYDDVKQISQNVANGKSEVLLIDVREPIEFQDGHIPGALNVPFKSSPGAFDLTEEEFEESFGFPKPTKDQELVFYCLGGVRSTAAEELANTFGYTKRGNYIGSYEDWVVNETAAKKA